MKDINYDLNHLSQNNGKIMEIQTQAMEYISYIIEKKFEVYEFIDFQTEKQVLEYFYDNERKCLNDIELNFIENIELYQFYRNFTLNIIEGKYENNNKISNIKYKIKSQLEKIISVYMKNENLALDNLYDIFLEEFNTVKIPKFIEEKIVEEIKNIQLDKELKINKITNNINFFDDKGINEKKQEFLLYYSDLINEKSVPFQSFDKKVLFDILIYSNLKDIYINEKIKKIFIKNRSDISDCFNYYNNDFGNLINNKKETDYIDNKLKETFNKYEINDLHLYIIASYFYLIMNVMKDINYSNNKDIDIDFNKNNININKPFFNRILRNVLYNFSLYCPSQIYIFEIYLYLIKCFNEYIFTNGNSEKENKEYNINVMEYIIKNSYFFGIYDNFKYFIEKIKEIEIDENNIFNSQNFSLIPLQKKRNSNTINILVSGFLSEKDDINTWKHFFNYDKKYSNYYFFRWPSSDIITYIYKTYKFWLKSSELFLKCRQKAKNAGKILAIFLACNQEFNNCQINLVGFSLGCQVVKYCIKELENIEGHRDMINNVLFMGGATVINKDKENIWKNIFIKNVGGKIINCYSKYDYILKYLFTMCVGKNPIGLHKIDLKIGKYNVVENYDFSDLKLGHLNYRDQFRDILKRINFF